VQRELETLRARLAERHKRMNLLRVQMDEAGAASERIRSSMELLETQSTSVRAEEDDAARWLDESARSLEAASAEVGELEERIGKRRAEVEATRERLRALDATLASHAAEEGRLANAVRELQVDLDMER
jgi:chromosome segregation ATPase